MNKIYDKMYYIIFPYRKFNATEQQKLKATILIENIKRLKVIGWVGSIVNIAIILTCIKSYIGMKGIDIQGVYRIAWIISSFAYIFFVGNPVFKEDIRTRHIFIFNGAASLSLIFSSLITVVVSSDSSFTFLYIINELLTGSFLYFYLVQMVFVLAPSFFIIIYAIINNPNTSLLQQGNMINISAVTLFALAMSQLNFKSQRTQFEFQEIIKRQNDELKSLSEIDELTEIANRRKLNQVLQHEWQRARKGDQKFSIAMLDIDLFKSYNDTYGHQAGDQCLKEIATIIKSSLRDGNDFVGRYGGEEFIILLPETSLDEANTVAERICNNIYDANIIHSSIDLKRITVSLGVVSTSSWNGTSIDEMVEESDKALYRAKQSGRNKVVAFELENELNA